MDGAAGRTNIQQRGPQPFVLFWERPKEGLESNKFGIAGTTVRYKFRWHIVVAATYKRVIMSYKLESTI